LWADKVAFAVADSEAAALAQVEHYFDGDSESDRAHDLWYNADGVPHEWVNGTNGQPGGWEPIVGDPQNFEITRHGEPLRVIQDVDWVLEDRDDSTNQLRVTTTLAEADGVEEEQELIFQNRRFVVFGVERDRHADRATIVADEAQVELAGHVLKDFEFNSWTAMEALEHALRDTRWTPGEVANVRYGRAQFEDLTILEACHFLANHQDAYVTFDSLRRRVNLSTTRGTAHEHVFTYGRELANIEKESEAPVTTVIYPTGADDMTIKSVNGGRDYVEDYGYYTSKGIRLADARRWYRKVDYWDDNRYEIPENMKRDAEKRLAEEAYPAVTYTLVAEATTSVDGTDDFDLTAIGLGDRVYVWDEEIDTKLVAEVSAVTTSSDQSQNELVLSSLPVSFGGPSTGGRRGSGQFFGDSGSTADSAVFPRSGFQPRPSMPILESLTDVGVATVRWNGQDHDGNYEDIPVRFGSVIPRVAKLDDDGVIPSPESDDAYEGTRIVSRGGGMATVSFGSPGEYAVWFYMLGSDQKATSEYSDPLMVTVDALVNMDDIDQSLQDANDRIDQVRDNASEAFEDYDQRLSDYESDLGDAERAIAQAAGLASTALDLSSLDDHVHVQEEQPEAPPAGQPAVTYAWEGEAHDSPSVKRAGGVVVGRNWIINPEMQNNTNHWFMVNVASKSWTTEFSQMWGRGEQPKARAEADNPGYMALVHQPEIPVSAGDWVAVRGLVATERGRSMRIQCWWYEDPNSASLSFIDGASHSDAGWYEGKDVTEFFQAPEGAQFARFRVVLDAQESGDRLWIDRFHAAVADSEQAALDQVAEYFDGDTQSVPPVPATSGIWVDPVTEERRGPVRKIV
jgi:phage minor structural protein